ncbi:MAG: hypothetical protein AAGH99_07205 [Planctomycetota bacterium]
MATFLITLVVLGGLSTCCASAIPRRWWVCLLPSWAIAVGLFVVHPWIAAVNINDLLDSVLAPGAMAQIMLLLVVESMLLAWACYASVTRVAGEKTAAAWPGGQRFVWLRRGVLSLGRFVVYLPSPALILGLLYAQSWIFHHFSNATFARLALMHAAGVFVLLVAASVACRLVLPGRSVRLEFRFLLAMLQLGLAVFLPVWINGARAVSPPQPSEVLPAITVWVCLAALAGAGFAMSRKGKRL